MIYVIVYQNCTWYTGLTRNVNEYSSINEIIYKNRGSNCGSLVLPIFIL